MVKKHLILYFMISIEKKGENGISTFLMLLNFLNKQSIGFQAAFLPNLTLCGRRSSYSSFDPPLKAMSKRIGSNFSMPIGFLVPSKAAALLFCNVLQCLWLSGEQM